MRHVFRWFAPWLFMVALDSEAAGAPIVLILPMSPEMSAFADSLASQPSYAALVFRNAGVPLSFSKQLSIEDSAAFRLGNYAVRYVKKQEATYFYEVRTMTDLGTTVVTPVQIDCANINAGLVQIRLYPEFAELAPKWFVKQIELKLKTMMQPAKQKILVNYLVARSKNIRNVSESERLRLNRK
jgi:hypothetical protein